MIIAKLQGGLGNQMFQYAFGRMLALRNSTELKLDVTMFPTYKYHKLMIGHLNITAPFASRLEVSRLAMHRRQSDWPWKIFNPLLRNQKRYFVEPTCYFDPALLGIKPPCLVDGYWLCEKYFLDIENIIREEFTVRGALNDYTKHAEEKIRDAQHPIMLHVRRGDFTAPEFAHKHGTVSPTYYARALSIMRGEVPNATYFIFSDDPEWARENVRPDAPTEYIGQGADVNYMDLHLMTLCEHFILANSTYGWWGAWLSQSYRHNTTIMPKYMTNKMDTRDLAHESWIVLDDASYSARRR